RCQLQQRLDAMWSYHIVRFVRRGCHNFNAMIASPHNCRKGAGHDDVTGQIRERGMSRNSRGRHALLASTNLIALLIAMPAQAQTATPPSDQTTDPAPAD